jgi:L-threonylcarbamoyladenylate synthase
VLRSRSPLLFFGLSAIKSTMQTELIFESNLNRAAQFLKKGDPVAFPTETVYGLGAPIFNARAIEKIFILKGRPRDNPLICHISHVDQVFLIARDIPKEFYCLADHFFPGPLTIILRKNPLVPSIVSAGLDTVAFRMPSHPIAQTLIDLVQEPLAAPSANLSGKPSSTNAKHVLEDFEGKISAVVDGGECLLGTESTVVSLVSPDRPILLRPGTIAKEHLEAILKNKVEIFSREIKEGEEVSSPGMKYRHYAPMAPLKLFTSVDELISHCRSNLEIRRMLLSRTEIPELKGGADPFFLSIKELYACLRHSDREGYQEVLVFCDNSVLNEPALMNRLSRAALIPN